MPTRAFLRASLALWRRRATYRRHRLHRWQHRVDRARAADTHPRQRLVDRRDHWKRLLHTAERRVALRRRQLTGLGLGHARGIDVSNNNGHVDWARIARAGYRFAWVKASEGHTFTDGLLTENVQGARRHGIHVGAYHFLTGAPIAEQADHFVRLLDSVGLGKGDLLPVVDVEKSGVVPAHAFAFSDHVHRHLGVRPIIYTFPSFAAWPSDALGHGALWIAHFDVRQPTIPDPWTSYAAWQHSSSGSVPGVNGHCDLNTTHDLGALIW